MRNVFRTSLLLIVIVLSGVSRAAAADLTVTAQVWDIQGVAVGTVGGTSAVSTNRGGSYLVGDTGSFIIRPIIPFTLSDFASVAGQAITSATFSFTVGVETLESTDLLVSSEVRLFSTTFTNLPVLPDPSHNIVAALTADGGAHTAVGTLSFADGLSGLVTLDFNAAGISALQTAINGSDPTIGIALREFAAQGDTFDIVTFPVDLDRPTLRVTTVPIPEPTSMALLGVGSLVLLRRRRRASRVV